jgi:vancomycin resistance protein VanW
MNLNGYVEKPKKRSKIRYFFGKEFYVLKRKLKWYLNNSIYAKVDKNTSFLFSVKRHKSFLLRPLKDVEMYLQHNKVTNLKIAINKIDKVVIKPGQTFSIWKLVGRPTRSNGYLEGLSLNNGKINTDIGGGLCQLGNLLYWMALHTPLTIKERWRHGYDVFPDINRTIPFACGATLSYNYIDLQLENNTNFNFQISLWIDKEYLNGEITSDFDLQTKYEIFETDHIIRHQWWGGYTRHNKIWKKIINFSEDITSNELVTENNAIMMYNPLLD